MNRLSRAAAFRAVLLLTVLMSVPRAGAAQNDATRTNILVSVDWLAQHLDDPDLVLIHVGPEDEYPAEHIPGARYIARDQMSHPGSHGRDALILELPEATAFQQVLRELGVSNSSRIVVYWADEWVTRTARVVFTFDWAGLGDRTVLLNGGIEAWKAAGHPVTSVVPSATTGDVTVTPRADLVVDADWVREHAGSRPYALVDGRARAFFDGLREDRGKSGHIPGAGSVPWTELIDEHLRLKRPDSLRALFAAAGVEPSDTVVAYCHIGQYATLVLLAARTLGHDVKLYDGAFQDWATRNLPVTSNSAQFEP